MNFVAIDISHIELVAEIDRRCFGTSIFSEEMLTGILPHPSILGSLAYEGDEVLGQILFRLVGDESEILTISVLPEFRGKGVAKALMEYGLEQVHRQGAEQLFLEVRPSNEAAIGLYERFGGEQVGLRPGYYQDTDGSREDAMVLSINLETSSEK